MRAQLSPPLQHMYPFSKNQTKTNIFGGLGDQNWNDFWFLLLWQAYVRNDKILNWNKQIRSSEHFWNEIFSQKKIEASLVKTSHDNKKEESFSQSLQEHSLYFLGGRLRILRWCADWVWARNMIETPRFQLDISKNAPSLPTPQDAL